VVAVTDPGGNTTTVTSANAAGDPTEVLIENAAAVTTEEWLYSYVTSGVNTGKPSTVEQEVKRSGSLEPYRYLNYTYYDGSTSDGVAGNIASATITDAGGNTIQQSHYI